MKHSIFSKISLFVASACMVVAGITFGANKIATRVDADENASITSFSATSGDIKAGIISYAAYQGDGTTAPVINTDCLRIYKPATGKDKGSYISVDAAFGYYITSISFVNSSDKASSYILSVDDVDGSSTAFAKNAIASLSTINASNVKFYNTGSERLSIASISLTYAGGIDPAVLEEIGEIQSDLNENVTSWMDAAYSFTKTPNEGEPATFSVQYTDFKTDSYASNNGEHKKSGITFQANDLYQNSSRIQMKKSSGYIYNSTPLSGMTTITVSSGSNIEVYVSSSVLSSSGGTKLTGEAGVYTVSSGNSYFRIQSTGSTAYLNSFTIDYISVGFDYTSDFRFRCAIDDIIEVVAYGHDGAKYGIEVNDGKTTKQYYSDGVGNHYRTDVADYHYVIIDLGDVLNNPERLTVNFTVKAFVEFAGQTLYNEENTKTYSVVSAIKKYYGMPGVTAKVSSFYQLLEDDFDVDFSKVA